MIQRTKTLQKLYAVSTILLIMVSIIFTVALIATSHERKQGTFELSTSPDSVKVSDNQKTFHNHNYNQAEPITEISSQDPIMPILWRTLLISIGIWILFIVLLVLDGISKINKPEDEEE